jgi:hypothetical protein
VKKNLAGTEVWEDRQVRREWVRRSPARPRKTFRFVVEENISLVPVQLAVVQIVPTL